MIFYIGKRILQGTVVIVITAFLSFLLFNFVTDPVANMVGQETTAEDMEALRERLGFNDPVPVQFVRFMGNAVQGEFGISYQMQRSVKSLFRERFPATFELVMVSTLLALVIGIPLGVYTGLHRNGKIANGILGASLIGVSLPTFIISILFIYLFAVILRWLPPFGRGDTVAIVGYWTTGLLSISGLKSIILPAFTLCLYQLALILRIVRSEMLEALQTDYIKFAKARGLQNRVINYEYAFKNTLIPVITVLGLQVSSMLAFSVVTESVFQWPGLGMLFIQAAQFGDIPIITAYLLMATVIFVSINLLVDVIYYLIDPRLRVPSSSAAG